MEVCNLWWLWVGQWSDPAGTLIEDADLTKEAPKGRDSTGVGYETARRLGDVDWRSFEPPRRVLEDFARVATYTV